MKKTILGLMLCGVAGFAAWRLASAEGRVDADERVASLLPPPGREAWWEPSQAFQAFSFGGQAMLGVAMFGLAWMGMRRPTK